jgi:cytochrome c553
VPAGAEGFRRRTSHKENAAMKKLLCLAVMVAAVGIGGHLVAADKAKSKIETIMEKAHKGGKNSLRNRVLRNEASKEELATLVELYTELGKATPPKGSKESWKEKTTAVLEAAKKVKEDPTDKMALAAYNKATTCMACHDVHKEEE